MYLRKHLTFLLAAAALASGCASQHAGQNVRVTWVVTHPDPLNYGKRLMTGDSDGMALVGRGSGDISTVFPIRECDASHTYCAAGEAKPVFSYTVQGVHDGKATLAANVSYDVGHVQTIGTKGLTSSMTATYSIHDGVPLIQGHVSGSKVGTIPLGEFRQIQLPNGVNLAFCVATSTMNGYSEGSACDASAVQSRPGTDVALKPF